MHLPVEFLAAEFRTDHDDALLVYRPVVMARFPTERGPMVLRRYVVDFLVDNDLELVLSAVGGSLSGTLVA